jgi:hypothetical protein
MPGRPLDANAHDLDRLVGQPLQGLPQPVIGVGKAHHGDVGAETVDQADGDAVLVRVDPADCLLHVLPLRPVSRWTAAAGSARQCWVQPGRLLSGQRRSRRASDPARQIG